MAQPLITDGAQLDHTHVLSHSGPIQEGVEKLGIWGRLRGRLGTLGKGTLGKLLVIVLPEFWRKKRKEGNRRRQEWKETKKEQQIQRRKHSRGLKIILM